MDIRIDPKARIRQDSWTPEEIAALAVTNAYGAFDNGVRGAVEMLDQVMEYRDGDTAHDLMDVIAYAVRIARGEGL